MNSRIKSRLDSIIVYPQRGNFTKKSKLSVLALIKLLLAIKNTQSTTSDVIN